MVASLFERVFCDNRPLALHLAGFLPAGCILALHRVNRECRAVCETWRTRRLLSQRVIKALEERNHGEGFRVACQASKAIVSGSLILCAIEGGSWEADDVDIYQVDAAPYNHPHHQFSPIEDHLWERASKDKHNFCYDRYEGLGTFLIVRNYYIPRRGSTKRRHRDTEEKEEEEEDMKNKRAQQQRCQVMVLSKDASCAAKWVDDNYDLQFLVNTFDGRNLTIHHPVSLITGESAYRPNNHTTDNAVPEVLPCHLQRIAKYTTRGFHITNVRDEQETVDGVDMVVHYLNNKPWGAHVRRAHVVRALTFPPIPNLVPAFDPHKARMPIFPPESIHFVSENSDVLLDDLFCIIRQQISRSYHRAEHLAYQDHLNQRFGHLHRFYNVN
jgi:hypothetical protein